MRSSAWPRATGRHGGATGWTGVWAAASRGCGAACARHARSSAHAVAAAAARMRRTGSCGDAVHARDAGDVTIACAQTMSVFAGNNGAVEPTLSTACVCRLPCSCSDERLHEDAFRLCSANTCAPMLSIQFSPVETLFMHFAHAPRLQEHQLTRNTSPRKRHKCHRRCCRLARSLETTEQLGTPRTTNSTAASKLHGRT